MDRHMKSDSKLGMAQGEVSTSRTKDVEEIVISMREKLDYYYSLDHTRQEGTNLCIIKEVSKEIREVDLNSYEPIILSIGPYHYGKPGLQVMEKEKWNCLDYTLKLNPERKLYEYLNDLTEIEEQAKLYYSEKIDIDSQDFLRMMMLDGCFLLVSLCALADVAPNTKARSVVNQEDTEVTVTKGKSGYGKEKITEWTTTKQAHSKNNFVTGIELLQVNTCEQSGVANTKDEDKDQNQQSFNQIVKWHDSFMKHDLFLLENQIPFLIIRRIYEQFTDREKVTFLTENFCEFVENILHQYPIGIEESNRPKEFHHLLHLFHMYLKPSRRTEYEKKSRANHHYFNLFLCMGKKILRLSHNQEGKRRKLPSSSSKCSEAIRNIYSWRRAMQYHEAGVVFKKKDFDRNNPHSLLDITFHHGVLEIPCLSIDQSTAALFRNLIAMEKTSPIIGNDFTAYISFLSQAMSTHNDVTLLSQRGIVIHQMRSDEEVSVLFSKIGKNLDFDPNGRYYLKYMCHMLEEHCQNRVNRWMAWLLHNHFRNPWLGLAVGAGAVVLLCTILQTWFAFLAYVRPMEDDTSLSSD